MKRLLACVTASAVILILALLPAAALAKTCRSGYTHAVIGGVQKCLHAGEYCSHSEASQYRRYHYVCDDINGTYRLERS